jgi:hypothetical protein
MIRFCPNSDFSSGNAYRLWSTPLMKSSWQGLLQHYPWYSHAGSRCSAEGAMLPSLPAPGQRHPIPATHNAPPTLPVPPPQPQAAQHSTAPHLGRIVPVRPGAAGPQLPQLRRVHQINEPPGAAARRAGATPRCCCCCCAAAGPLLRAAGAADGAAAAAAAAQCWVQLGGC